MDESKSVLFIDPVCPKEYDNRSLEGCGGTELTVVSVAEALACKGYNVAVSQHNRHTNSNVIPTVRNVWYCPFDETPDNPDYVIVLRQPEALLQARERFPNSDLFLWSHDLYDRSMATRTMAAIEATNPKYLLCVSDYHRGQIRTQMAGLPSDASTRLRVTYPPISDDLKPDSTPVDPYKLSFISSPHKGLDYALEIFKYIRRREGRMVLHVTNPGYFETKSTSQAGVKVHGSLKHDEVLSLLRSSLCLFFPNTVFPETFGRVFAESEAVGTPALTHNLGAAAEVVSDCRSLVDCTNIDAVVERVLEWCKGKRPTVRMKRSFRMQRVIGHWIREIFS